HVNEATPEYDEAAPEYIPPSLRLTYDDYCHIPPGHQRYELIGGAIRVVPSPSVSHQQVSKRLQRALMEWIEDRGLGEVYDAPLDVVLSKYDVVQPDLLYVSRDRLGIIREANIWGPPDLVVEILSPGTARWDQEVKRQLYAKFGVREFWLVDPVGRTIEVATLERGESATLQFTALQVYAPGSTLMSPLLPGFTLDIEALFA
ncbi:MAG: Uma2 family endonuclease, partial [Bacillota bacterium]